MEGLENMGNAIPVELLAVAGVVFGVIAAARKFLRTTFKGFGNYRGELASIVVGLSAAGLIGFGIGAANEAHSYKCEECWQRTRTDAEASLTDISSTLRGRYIGAAISSGIGGIIVAIILGCIADEIRKEGLNR